MKIIGKRPSREKCAESGWFATDYLMDAPIGREFILKLKPLAVHGKHEDELEKLEAFILDCVKE